MKATHMISFILLVIGGLNWGIEGVMHFFGNDLNVVAWLLGSWPWLLNVVYILVGISAILVFCGHKKDCKMCDSKSSAPMSGQQM